MGNGGLIGNISNPTYNSAKGVWYLNSPMVQQRVERVTFITSGTSTTPTIAIPSDAQVGDVAILFDRASATSGIPTSVTPANWNVITDQGFSGTNASRLKFSYKIIETGEPGTNITGMDGAFNEKKIIMIFRPLGNWKIPQITLSTPSTEITDGNPAAQTISMTASSPVLIGMVGYASGSAIDPRTATGATFEEVGGPDTGLYVKYCTFNLGSTPTDATVDMDDEGNNNGLHSFWIRIS